MFTDFPPVSSKQGSQQSRSSSAVTSFSSLLVPHYSLEQTTTHKLTQHLASTSCVLSLCIPWYSRLVFNPLTHLFTVIIVSWIKRSKCHVHVSQSNSITFHMAWSFLYTFKYTLIYPFQFIDVPGPTMVPNLATIIKARQNKCFLGFQVEMEIFKIPMQAINTIYDASIYITFNITLYRFTRRDTIRSCQHSKRK